MELKAQIRQEYRDAIRAGEKARGLAAKIAKEHDIPDATVRSWINRDKQAGLPWDDLSIPDEAFDAIDQPENVATNSRNVATKPENVATEEKRDWEALRVEFVTGNYKSLKEFCNSQEIPYTSHFREKASGWIEEKQTKGRQTADKIIDDTLDKTAEKVSDEISDFAVHTAKTLLDVYEENQAIERTLLAKLYQRTDQIIEEMNQKQVVTKRKRKAKLETRIPADLNVGGTQILTDGDLEYIVEDTEENIDIVVGIVDHDKYEAVSRGLERIQKMNRIVNGIERIEKREDRLIEREARMQEQADRSRASVLGNGAGSTSSPEDGGNGKGRPIIVEFGIPRPDWSKRAEAEAGEDND